VEIFPPVLEKGLYQLKKINKKSAYFFRYLLAILVLVSYMVEAIKLLCIGTREREILENPVKKHIRINSRREMHLIPRKFCEELELVYINVTMKS
jgi:hypothetical protein